MRSSDWSSDVCSSDLEFIIFEDFGQADPDNPSQHEYYSAADNTIAGISVPVYFRKAELSDIHLNNLLFYIPSNPPSSYGQSKFGPQYRDNVKKGSYSIVTNSRGYQNQFFRSEERRVWNECVGAVGSRWSRYI